MAFQILDKTRNTIEDIRSTGKNILRVNTDDFQTSISDILQNEAKKYLVGFGLADDDAVELGKTLSTDVENHGTIVYKNPVGGFYSNFNNLTWIHLLGKKLKSQTSTVKGGRIQVDDTQPVYDFSFIAPEEMMETISHDWTEYESWVNRLGGLLQTGTKLKADLRGIGTNIQQLVDKGVQSWEESDTSTLTNYLKNVSPETGIPQTRIDSPLVYSGSQRREWNFTVHLAAFKNPVKEIALPVFWLMKLSCPQKHEGSVYIEAPYVFKFKTYDNYANNNNLIYSNWCALKAVQPTWSGPYIRGYPLKCDLTLTLVEIEPLYSSTIGNESRVNVYFQEEPINRVYSNNEREGAIYDAWRILKGQIRKYEKGRETLGLIRQSKIKMSQYEKKARKIKEVNRIISTISKG